MTLIMYRPILTYGNQGVSKEGAVKWKHAIAFTGKKDHEPAAHASEQPALREYGMMSPIRVRPRTKQEKLHTMSRINFSKIYTVEHNVKVYDFGVVHPDYVSRLKTQWRYVLDHEGEGHPSDLVIETPQPQPIYTPQSYASPQYAIPQTHNPQPYGTTQTYGAPQHQPYAQPQTYPSAGAYPGYAQPTMQSYNTAAPTQTTQMAQGYGTSTSQTTQSYAVSTTQAYHTSSSQAHVMPWAQEYNTRTAQEYNIQPTSNSWAAQQHHQKDDSDDE
jgi:hypothetical protein